MKRQNFVRNNLAKPTSNQLVKKLPLNIVVFFLLGSSGCTTVAPEAVESPPNCAITYSDILKPKDFHGVRLNSIYKIDAQGNTFPDPNADSRNAADLFGRLHELPLRKMPPCVSEAYRLTWVPSFHQTTTVRFWKSEDGDFIIIKRLERTPENRNGYDYTEKGRTISVQDWENIRQTIDKFDFWHVASIENEALPNDGAAWLLEGWHNGRYHNVFRILPDIEFERLIRQIFDLTREPTEIELYLSAESAN